MDSQSDPTPKPRTTAFVLAGGASSAAYQVGALYALTQAGIRPDLVVGTSAGALNAAAYTAEWARTISDKRASSERPSHALIGGGTGELDDRAPFEVPAFL